jgi:hypothetical protein
MAFLEMSTTLDPESFLSVLKSQLKYFDIGEGNQKNILQELPLCENDSKVTVFRNYKIPKINFTW